MWMEVFELMGEMLDEELVVRWRKDWDIELSRKLDAAAILGLVGFEKMAGEMVRKTMTTLDLTCYTALYNDARKMYPPRKPKTTAGEKHKYQGNTDRLWMVACGFDIPLRLWETPSRDTVIWDPEDDCAYETGDHSCVNTMAMKLRVWEMYNSIIYGSPRGWPAADLFTLNMDLVLDDPSQFKIFSLPEHEPENSETFYHMKRSKLKLAEKILRAHTGTCAKCSRTQGEHDATLCPDTPVMFAQTLVTHLIYIIGDMLLDGSRTMINLAREYVRINKFNPDWKYDEDKYCVMRRLVARWPYQPYYKDYMNNIWERPWEFFPFLTPNCVRNTLGIKHYLKKKNESWNYGSVKSHHPALCALYPENDDTYGHHLMDFSHSKRWEVIAKFATKDDKQAWLDREDIVADKLYDAYLDRNPMLTKFEAESNYKDVMYALMLKIDLMHVVPLDDPVRQVW